MSDLNIIERLNQQLHRPLKLIKKVSWITKGYVLNEHEQVTHLSIFKARLNGKVPSEIFDLKHLHYLDIRENQLEQLPDDIGKLTKLEYLDARINNLASLPERITQLKRLAKLYLGQNQYHNIPAPIAHLEQLKLIDFTDNSINTDCHHLIKAAKLTNIYLNNNQITTFPFEQLNDGQWDELVLIENPLIQKPDSVTNKVKRLIM
ncbi:hypothetical protein KDU71_06860 [Carboxylicivirga sediminis]|uniref:Disease resistance R13L4/SHOC-2-like LRR domain-containing protein n=1 Tax=Carboxylicivirga sediminis TaxID=2006564 RepID=A0A941IX66_9BACT|nr:hypothetical protein [Carboxylicivirga sediminis]MBR8535273.1 hypothetical protein [Carboxylicivirga sediminis]